MKCASLLLLTLSLPGCALADTTYQFNLTGGDQTLSFSLPSDPSTTNEGDDFYVTNVPYVLGGVSGQAYEVAFYDTTVGGGFAFGDASQNILNDLAYVGDQIFQGTTSMPVFIDGSFNLTSYFGDPTPLQLEVQSINTPSLPTPTPEPNALVLLGTGGVALAALKSLKQRATKRRPTA